ncbi:MFS transporter [Nonomuraea gerenzanensis]|uniref:MFS transporter n=1 Tax=Nonomuraea gerenzanensis TaxID=93944 RepID=A0A1M4E288_9ACTN|nr:MFS transporter [Nonomuraea gerenzanensis]UBU15189.1 MFS transporter [Nonomuraea gerenzanensis]SBO92931.1 MFS transporter [Nonomuraea gerenzanensis]
MTAPKALDAPHKPAGILGPEYRTATLGILLVVTLIAFEGMSVGVVMPAIAEELDALDLYGLSFSAFLIASLFMNVVAGLWSDRRGYPVPFLAGVVLFAVGMALAGAAGSAGMFLLARAVQGLGGGASIVALYVMIARVYPMEVRPKAFAAVSAAWVVPAMVGPSVAGFVGGQWGWRYVFYGIVPLVIPALVMLVPALRMGTATEAQPGTGPRSRPVAMTLAATATAGGAGLLLYGVDRLHVAAVGASVETVAGLALLVYGLYRLLPPGALRFRRGLSTTVLMRGFFSASFFGVNAFIPLALQHVKGFDTTSAGIALTTGALGWSAGSFLQSRRTGEPHKRIRLGAGCVTAAILVCMLAVVPGVSGWISVPAWIVAGFGMGFGITTISVTAMRQSPVNEQGANSASLSVTDQLGSALSIGIGGALVNVIGHASSQIATGFLVISALMAVIALGATLLAGRVR